MTVELSWMGNPAFSTPTHDDETVMDGEPGRCWGYATKLALAKVRMVRRQK